MMRKQQDQEGPVPLTEGAEVARRLAKQWVHEGAELIPLSVLSLDHPAPIGGWETVLEARGIELVEDDLRRPAVRREDARRLVEERREWERESVEKARRLQESLDGLPVPAGIPALEHGSAMEAVMAGDPNYRSPSEEFGRPRPNFLEEELAAGARQQAAAQAEAAAKKAARGKDG